MVLVVRSYGAGEARVAAMLDVPLAEARHLLGDFRSTFAEACAFKDRVQRDCSSNDMTVRVRLQQQRHNLASRCNFLNPSVFRNP
jgi:hypothetical protein